MTAGVFIYSESRNPNSTASPTIIGAIQAPGAPSGTLTVESVSGHRLSLTLTDSSATYLFDVAQRRFLN